MLNNTSPLKINLSFDLVQYNTTKYCLLGNNLMQIPLLTLKY